MLTMQSKWLCQKMFIILDELVPYLKSKNFNVRLSVNLTNIYKRKHPDVIFKRLKELKVDQVTFRILYTNEVDSKQDKWINTHKLNNDGVRNISLYVRGNGRKLEQLPFGAMKYSVDGISTVIDEDCMSTEVKTVMKYLILRENGKLYSKWDDIGSLIF